MTNETAERPSTRMIPNLDLFDDEFTMPAYRGIVRERAAQLVMGEITLGMFVDWLRAAERQAVVERIGIQVGKVFDDHDALIGLGKMRGKRVTEQDIRAILDAEAA